MTEQINADRFVCANDRRPKRKGKQLKKALAAAGYDIYLAASYELIAHMYGFRNFNELRASMGDGVIPSPNDEEVEEELFSSRFWHQVEKLKEVGVSQADAEDIIDKVRPTSATSSASPDTTSEPPAARPPG